jgi:phosphate transport system permease protein
MNSRKFINIIFVNAAGLAFVFCAGILVFLFGVILWNGSSAISFDFLTKPSENFGTSGGIVHQITGSILMVVSTAIITLPIGLGTAIYRSEYLKSRRYQNIADTLIFSLNGVPSVIFGVFGLIFFVTILGTGVSWFVGSIILAMMILPTLVLSAYQSINSVPSIYRESALALGMSKWQVVTTVLLPKAINGAITGLLIGLARAIGETAPIMFVATAFSGVDFPSSLLQPVSALPTHILNLAQQATDDNALQNAWGSSLVLVILVVLFSVSGLLVRLRFKNNNI